MPDSGDIRPVSFTVTTPGEPEAIKARMAANEARGLPEAAAERPVVIVGSGPSARDAALWAFLEANPDQPTCAVNNALRLFLEHRQTPTYWVACDAEQRVAEFVADAPKDTIYLVGSKVHPDVFDRLRDRDVRIWRLDEFGRQSDAFHVPCAVSVTLCAQSLLRLMGYNVFRHWGWDCCFLDGKDHASPQDGVDRQVLKLAIERPDGEPLEF